MSRRFVARTAALQAEDVLRALIFEPARNDFWTARLEPAELTRSLVTPPAASASSAVQNYLAAMVEQVCAARDVPAPSWARRVPPLERPWFGSQLQSLRLHLLRSSPAPFRRRNIFIDTGMGGRV